MRKHEIVKPDGPIFRAGAWERLPLFPVKVKSESEHDGGASNALDLLPFRDKIGVYVKICIDRIHKIEEEGYVEQESAYFCCKSILDNCPLGNLTLRGRYINLQSLFARITNYMYLGQFDCARRELRGLL